MKDNWTRDETAARNLPIMTMMMGESEFFTGYERIGADRVIVEAPAGPFGMAREIPTSLANAAGGDEEEHDDA